MIFCPLPYEAAEHVTQILIAPHGDNPRDHSKRYARRHQPECPEDLPVLHCASFIEATLTPPTAAGGCLPSSEPRINPSAARPNAQRSEEQPSELQSLTKLV